MEAVLAQANVWTDKATYDEAERIYLERIAKGAQGGDPSKKSSLAGEVAKAIEHLKISLEDVGDLKVASSGNPELQSRVDAVEDTVHVLHNEVKLLRLRVESIEKVIKQLETKPSPAAVSQQKSIQQKSEPQPSKDDDDDDVDLFGSDSEEEDEEAKRVKEQRVAEYAARKSKKPTLIAKSNIILDVKPWDDETDMKVMETEVRKVAMDGLVWGASKLVPLAYGIEKLQISCVVEDEKVSVDDLQEKIQEIEDYVQSIDIAAFNKV